VGGHTRLLSDRSAVSFHLLVVVLIAVSASFLPGAFTGNSATAGSSAVPRVEPTTDTVLLASSLGRSIPSLKVKAAVAPKVRVVFARTKRHAVLSHAKIHHAVAPLPTRTTVAPATTVASSQTTSTADDGSYGCGAALAYLSAHAAPGFSFECPGYADGHQAMTCENIPGLCPGTKLIAISVPCAAAYMNEASNSWVLSGESDAPIDPYGYCRG
jgi:hypothetical protein